jgi:hypothetical protein
MALYPIGLTSCQSFRQQVNGVNFIACPNHPKPDMKGKIAYLRELDGN